MLAGVALPAIVTAAAAQGRSGRAPSPAAGQTVQAPRFEVDPFWPQPLPDNRLLGSGAGIAIDARDHVWVVNLTDSFVQRTETGANADPPIGDCCFPSANVLEFDPSGKLVGHWGGPGTGYTWPSSNYGITVDEQFNVWIGGSGPRDTQILQFSRDGRFLKAIGSAAPPLSATPSATTPDTTYAGVSGAGRGTVGAAAAAGARGGAGRGRGAAIPPLPANSASRDMFGGPAQVAVDAAANELFIADGFRHRRVAVVDRRTGAVKRMWGASGAAPVDPPSPAATRAFGTPVSCARLSADGLLYVCDRANNRIQVFRKSGAFVREVRVAPNTKGAGSVWDIAFSRDPGQRFLYVADGQNLKVHILDRASLSPLSAFGTGGRYPGHFVAVTGIATDSQGNIYTIEGSEGKRIQKFIFRGVQAVPRNQGVTWPGGR